ncbi:hypothetical protein NUV66_09340 [Pseudomonas sp. 32.2.56]|uniref:hypothetical protein n=1 Tax=Pseudomonas sp. 32.2.56 TaxID=2969303 RepID=UPI00214FF6A5|nr:hypothetical protein [Pseudomonas sp. 32.2.56]MCR4509508.1 hypothetical protein [Pseudomonas sp. 32.2.56]
MDAEEEQLGYVKYTGELVKQGYMDARKSAQALLGVDEAVRFFIFQQAPLLKGADFEFPVKIRKGAWEIVVGAFGAIALAYGIKAAQKMAENDFADVGMKDVLKKSLQGIQWLIRIGKHLGDLAIKKFDNPRFRDDNQLIGIRNSEGEYLYVPKEYFEFYLYSPPSLLKKIAEVVEDDRVLSVGVFEDGILVEEIVSRRVRQIFTQEEEVEEDQLFPDLEHGQRVVIEAEVTRGNEMSNTIGIGYRGHVITGVPEVGSIVRFKACLFLNCRISGRVSREDDKGRIDARRPKIIFSNIEIIESESKNLSLFDS